MDLGESLLFFRLEDPDHWIKRVRLPMQLPYGLCQLGKCLIAKCPWIATTHDRVPRHELSAHGLVSIHLLESVPSPPLAGPVVRRTSGSCRFYCNGWVLISTVNLSHKLPKKKWRSRTEPHLGLLIVLQLYCLYIQISKHTSKFLQQPCPD